MLAVSTTDTALLHTCVEALDCLEVEAVDIGLAKLQLSAAACSDVQIVGEDTGSQTILAVVGPTQYLVDVVELDDGQHRGQTSPRG